MPPPVRVLALDIDGTLLDSSFRISARDLEAVRRVHRSGVEVLLCTGRRFTFARPIAEMLGVDVWLCSSNGAVTRSSQGQDFDTNLLPAQAARELCRHMTDYRGSTVITFDQETPGALVVEDIDELASSIARWVDSNRSYIHVVKPIEDCLDRDPVQAMVCGSLEAMAEAERHLYKFPRLSAVSITKTQYDHRDLCILDVLNAGCSKGEAVARWLRSRGIQPEELMAIGDNFNDVEMLDLAGYPFVMGNASEELKSRGYARTAGNDENGVALAIEEVFGT